MILTIRIWCPFPVSIAAITFLLIYFLKLCLTFGSFMVLGYGFEFTFGRLTIFLWVISYDIKLTEKRTGSARHVKIRRPLESGIKFFPNSNFFSKFEFFRFDTHHHIIWLYGITWLLSGSIHSDQGVSSGGDGFFARSQTIFRLKEYFNSQWWNRRSFYSLDPRQSEELLRQIHYIHQ